MYEQSCKEHQLMQRNYSQDNSSAFCPPHFDSSLCWPGTSADLTVEAACPFFTFCTSIPGCAKIAEESIVRRYCDADGVWSPANYTACVIADQSYKHCLMAYCRKCPNPLRDAVIAISVTMSIISVVLLTAALVLFSMFKSLQCRRLTIHKNLACAFIFRFAFLAIWSIAQVNNTFKDCDEFFPRNKEGFPEVICKTILWFIVYFQVASVVWMFIEGAYLYSRFTIFAMRHIEPPYYVYPAAGWGFPAVIVLTWSILQQREIDIHGQELYCWVPYTASPHLWILTATMVSVLALNFLFLLGIVIILAQKLRAENSAESKMIWKTIKATLLLVPLLGISNLPLIYEPHVESSAYQLISAVLQHSQGIFIAVLYCFLSSEVQNAVKRHCNKFPFHLFRPFRKHSRSLERTYIPETKNYSQTAAIALEEANILNAEDEE